MAADFADAAAVALQAERRHPGHKGSAGAPPCLTPMSGLRVSSLSDPRAPRALTITIKMVKFISALLDGVINIHGVFMWCIEYTINDYVVMV